MLNPCPSRPSGILRGAACLLNLLLLATLVALGVLAAHTLWVPPNERGEYNADLRLLRKYYSPPQPGQANHVLDMLHMGHFGEFLRIQGLTNNHALFVLSHGRALSGSSRERFAYYPDDRLCAGQEPCYSVRDIARMIGADAAGKIHNVCLAGCNREGAFNSAEVRKYFRNATNITHTPAGKNGFEALFRQALMHSSDGLKVLYQMPDTFRVGDFKQRKPAPESAMKPSPYVAELYSSGEDKPFSIRTAGRELLGQPPKSLLSASAPGNRPGVSAEARVSAVMNTAIAALSREPVPAPPKSIVLVGSDVGGKKHRAAGPRLLDLRFHAPALAVFSKHLDLPLPKTWQEFILTGLLGLVMLKLGVGCLRLAGQEAIWEFDPRTLFTCLWAIASLMLTILASMT